MAIWADSKADRAQSGVLPAITIADGPPLHGGDEGARQPLTQMLPGQCARVTDIEAAAVDVQRLKALGMCPGRPVMLVQAGNPVIVRILGTRLGITPRLARCIHVQVCCINP